MFGKDGDVYDTKKWWIPVAYVHYSRSKSDINSVACKRIRIFGLCIFYKSA